MRTILFIDGRNFKYNLGAFRFKFPDKGQKSEDCDDGEDYYRLDEKHFLWQEFFNGIIEKFAKATGFNYRLIRVYWYNAGTIRPFEKNLILAKSIVDMKRDEFSDLNTDKVIELAKDWYDKQRSYFYKAKEEIYEGIQRKINFLEFKYTGEYVVRPFKVHKLQKNTDGSYFYQGTREGEKGVDVGIAVDMISKMTNYDVAILVSGDADFLPAVCHLKDNLKYVYQFSIAQGIPPNIKYLSPWLRGVVDVFQYFDEVELLETYLNPKSIPSIINRVIEGHIKELKKHNSS